MEQFRTEVPAPEFPFSIDHSGSVVMIGSCFTEYVGERLDQRKIPVSVNPFGILFNPFSIVNALERMLNDRPYAEEELVKTGDHWASLDHHGRFNASSKEEVLEAINTALKQGATALKNASVIFITLGSAWVYEHRKRNKIVGNCHRIPNKEFDKRLLSQQETHLILRHIPEMLRSKKIDAQVVFTVSPVRHWKDGAIENQRSKSQLISAVHAVVDEFSSAHYFPSYEYMMDDLRDYRFYGTDMIHPTPQAIDYIWQRFEWSFFSDETRIICQELKALMQAVQHRPTDPESNSFQRFLKKQLGIIAVVEKKYDTLDLSGERKHFESYVL